MAWSKNVEKSNNGWSQEKTGSMAQDDAAEVMKQGLADHV